MNFDESTSPITEYLEQSGFTVSIKEQHYIKYTSDNCTITIAYYSLEYIYYYHVGVDSNSLIELTPISIKEVFRDESYILQQSLTLDNFLTFLKSTGDSILIGDKVAINLLQEFSETQSKEYTDRIMRMNFIKNAENAWQKKDYSTFVTNIDKIDINLISDSLRKKYQIALSKLNGQIR